MSPIRVVKITLDANLVIAHRERRVSCAVDRHEVPDDSIETVKPDALPDDWQALPSSPGARLHGGRWLQTGALCFRLPSAVIPEEFTLLMNPLHPDAGKLRVSEPKVFRFDPRVT